MSNQNLVLKRPLDSVIINIIRRAVSPVPSLKMTPHDLPYYYVRVIPGRPLREQVFGPDPYADIRITTWLRIPTGVPPAGPLRREMEFLEGLGLAMMIPDSVDGIGSVQYAIAPQAKILYEEGTGVFINVNTDRDAKALRYIRLLLDYVLPGMFWRNYYATKGLAPHIHLSEHLGHEMLEISRLWDRLNARFPEGGVPGAPAPGAAAAAAGAGAGAGAEAEAAGAGAEEEEEQTETITATGFTLPYNLGMA